MDGNDFAQGTLQGYSFGLGKHETIDALRNLADRIEQGDALIQRVRTTVSATLDDFTATTLRLVLHEKKSTPKVSAVPPAPSAPTGDPLLGDDLVRVLDGHVVEGYAP